MTLVISIAAICVGLVLGALGGGGSILVVPALVYLVDMPEKAAIATSLLVVGGTSMFALIPYARRKEIDWRTGGVFAAFAMVGAAGGGWAAQFFSGSFLMMLFAGFMLVTATAMFRGKRDPDDLTDSKKLAPVWIAVEGIVVGALTGLVGAGGGFLVVPALVLLGGLEMRKAVGTSLMVISLKSFAGFWAFSTHVSVDYALAGSFIVLAVFGAFVGQNLAGYIPAAGLRKVFAGFVLVMGVVVLAQQVHWAWVTLIFLAAVSTIAAFTLKSNQIKESHDVVS